MFCDAISEDYGEDLEFNDQNMMDDEPGGKFSAENERSIYCQLTPDLTSVFRLNVFTGENAKRKDMASRFAPPEVGVSLVDSRV